MDNYRRDIPRVCGNAPWWPGGFEGFTMQRHKSSVSGARAVSDPADAPQRLDRRILCLNSTTSLSLRAPKSLHSFFLLNVLSSYNWLLESHCGQGYSTHIPKPMTLWE